MKKFMLLSALFFCLSPFIANAQTLTATFNECSGDELTATFDSATSTITVVMENEYRISYNALDAFDALNLEWFYYPTDTPKNDVLYGWLIENHYDGASMKTIGARADWQYGRDKTVIASAGIAIHPSQLKVITKARDKITYSLALTAKQVNYLHCARALSSTTSLDTPRVWIYKN